MQTALDCYPCFLRQALSAARRAHADPAVQHRVLVATMARLSRSDSATTPIELAADIHRLVREHTGHPDPYLAAKEDATRQALALYPRLEALITNAADPLQAAVRVAIAGNIIDFGVAEHYDLEATLERIMQQPFAIDGIEPLRQALQQAKVVLYLADNTGETVFDRVLIETLGIPVTYVVKGAPVLNDATRTDALAAAIDQIAAIVDNGSDAPGTLLEACSEDFRRRFAAADLILAKGQGNYESLSQVQAPVFFLLQAKCSVIADDLGVPVGSIVCRPPDAGSLTDARPVSGEAS